MKKLVVLFLLPLLFSCESDPSQSFIPDDFVGSWQCKETSTLYGQSTYDVQAVLAAPSDGLMINNFYNNQLDVRVLVNGSGWEIPLQTVDGFTIQGSGQSNGDATEVSVSYSVDDGVDNDQCSAIFVKQ